MIFFLPRRSRRLWWRLILLYNHIGKKGSWLWQCLFIINSGSINLGNQFSFFAVANLWNFYAFLEKKLVFIIYWNAKLHSSEIQDVRLNWLPGETLHNLPYLNMSNLYIRKPFLSIFHLELLNFCSNYLDIYVVYFEDNQFDLTSWISGALKSAKKCKKKKKIGKTHCVWLK